MNSKIFTIFVTVLAISASGECRSQSNLKKTKEEVAKYIDDLLLQVSTIKGQVTSVETNIETEYTTLKDEATRTLDTEKEVINSQIDDFYKTCQDDKCKSCFEDKTNVETSYEEQSKHIQSDSQEAFDNAVNNVNSLIKVVDEYDTKIKDFKTTLEACEDDNNECISGVDTDVANYKTDTVDKDDSKAKADSEDTDFKITIINNDEAITKGYNGTCDGILAFIKSCVENSETTTQIPETTTNSQAKLIFNVFILISMLVVSKIFAQ